MDMNQVLAAELNVKPWQVEAAVKLIDEGNTIPFISRYRKEATGSLNDEILRNLYDRLMYLRSLNDRKAVVLASIEEQGKLTAEPKKCIEEAATLVVVEDLYRPYRPKRRTRATIAKEKGLEPLANIILLQMTKEPLEKEAEAFVSEEKEVKTAKDAIAGACDIIAESISDEADYRMEIRRRTEAKGLIVSTAKDEKAESVYENYCEFSEPVSKIAGHRVLALNRGEKEKFLNVKIEAPTEEILRYLEKKIITKENPQTKPVLQATIEDAYNRLIAPAIEREVRNQLTEKAEDGAIKVFGKNLEQLLMQPPIAGQVVLGWDPAFRTGCKLAVVDATGKVLDTTVVYPTAPTNEKKIAAAKATVKDLIHKYGVTLISVGNGTASRESEQIIVEILKEIPEIDAVLGTTSYDSIVEAVNTALEENTGEHFEHYESIDYLPDNSEVERVVTTGNHMAYLKIAEGCDKRCSYCIIPKIRGRFRSVPMQELLNEAKRLASEGVKELVLVAQETTLYGKDLTGEKQLPLLLHELCKIEGIEWIRLLYCYPEEITDELIKVIKTEEKVCNYIDMPIQHSENRILQRMGSRTSREDMVAVIKKLRQEIPDITIRTTLITGFPGETKEQHKELLEFINDMEFDRLGVFTYSPEEGTPAAAMEHQIDEEVKLDRQAELMELQQDISAELGERRIGQELLVMIEGKVADEDAYVGRSQADAPGVDGYVFVNTPETLVSGDFVRVKITGALEYDLIGEISQ